jgi:flagellar biosynthetic protein FliP
VNRSVRIALALGLVAFGILVPALVEAQEAVASGPSITLSMPDGSDRAATSASIRMLLLLTVLSIAPGILISMTSFTRIVIVLTFARQAVGTQSSPPTQVLLALALLLTGVVMTPVLSRIHDEALTPYLEERMNEEQAAEVARLTISEFLIGQVRESDVLLFYELAHEERPATADQIPLRLLVPAFMLSELRTSFEMGFLLYLPFVLIDLLVASVLTSMGMMMMPPTMISTPLKLLLFVLVDGWALLVRSLALSFG